MDNKNYSKGICWIDDCRIPFVNETLNGGGYGGKNMGTAVYALSDGRKTLPTNRLKKEDFVEPSGRFPANILVSDDMLNDSVISKTNTKGQIRSEKRNWNITSIMETTNMNIIQDKGTNSRYYDIDKWFDKILND